MPGVWRTGLVVLLLLGVGASLVACGFDDEGQDATAECESWVDKVESGEASLTREQEVAIRATLVIGKDAADALAFEATPMCEAAAGFHLVSPDGSLTPMALYIAYECGVAPQEGKRVCELLDEVSVRISQIAEDE